MGTLQSLMVEQLPENLWLIVMQRLQEMSLLNNGDIQTEALLHNLYPSFDEGRFLFLVRCNPDALAHPTYRGDAKIGEYSYSGEEIVSNVHHVVLWRRMGADPSYPESILR